jgi:hypothetical protein
MGLSKIAASWIVAFLGVMILVVTVIGTLIQSLRAHTFVWGTLNYWGIGLAIGFIVVGMIAFVISSFRAVDKF